MRYATCVLSIALACCALASGPAAAAGQRDASCSVSVVVRTEGLHDVWEVVGTGFPVGQQVRIDAVNRVARQSVALTATATESGFSGVFIGRSADGQYVALAPGVWKVRARSGAASAKVRFTVAAPVGQKGEWGGEHMGLVVTDSGGTVEFDCAHGTIDEPIRVDADGTFDVSGVYIRDHGGPIRQGEREDGHAARFKGRIDRDTMTVTIEVPDFDVPVGTFTLTRGANPRVFKCA